ncbi:MAG: hypothetical protein KF784_07240 [Fimbriimonadaceae bacterium]|nr:hypothetical protein [Fimbriimonadaceae bacterium]
MLASLAIAAFVLAGPTLDERIAEILPTKQEEKWLSIPWRTNLYEARKVAQSEGKPIFMWIMNGHPFGCT